MKYFRIFSIVTLNALTPIFAFAAPAPTDFKSLIAHIVDFIRLLIIVIFALTFLAIIWGVVKGWILGGSSDEGVESGKQVVTIGIIALVVMISVWSIVYLLQSSFFGG